MAEHRNEIYISIDCRAISTYLTRMDKLDAPITMTGRDETVDDLLSEKRFVFEFRMWSRSLRSSLAQMSCAAPPVGQRMMGTTPIVTTTEKSPETIRSTKLSSS